MARRELEAKLGIIFLFRFNKHAENQKVNVHNQFVVFGYDTREADSTMILNALLRILQSVFTLSPFSGKTIRIGVNLNKLQ